MNHNNLIVQAFQAAEEALNKPWMTSE
jgi:hypothetical protein